MTETKKGVVFGVKALPNAGKSSLAGVYNGMLKVKVSAPPDKGKANKELVKILSKTLKVNSGFVEIIKGEKARQKTVLVMKMTKQELKEAINE